ncbi:MAG TPA: hypothetical protein VMG35_00460 [Bryobacteraceae bacterium]|nr:hypothetical protein [Bryobacteraceae bacterium]
MHHADTSKDTRRGFLLQAACIGSATIAAPGLAAEDPFNALPASL